MVSEKCNVPNDSYNLLLTCYNIIIQQKIVFDLFNIYAVDLVPLNLIGHNNPLLNLIGEYNSLQNLIGHNNPLVNLIGENNSLQNLIGRKIPLQNLIGENNSLQNLIGQNNLLQDLIAEDKFTNLWLIGPNIFIYFYFYHTISSIKLT